MIVLAREGFKMNQLYIMDILFDLLNESDGLDVKELEEDEAAGAFFLTTGDGTRVQIQCKVLPQAAEPQE